MARAPAWRAYARALLTRRPALLPPGAAFPRLARTAEAVGTPPGRLGAYRRACGLAAGGALPLAWPHVLAAPLHLALLTDPRFPLRPLGLVHLRNRIVRARPLADGDALDLRCTLTGARETERGQELDLVTEAWAGGRLAWSEESVLLARRPAPRRSGTAAPAGELPGLAEVGRLAAPAGTGRRYARASGDWNPIHLSALTGRAFGFPRAIAHGMWTLARVAALLEPRVAAEAVALEATFRAPVLLPAELTVLAATDGDGLAFAVRDGRGERTHVVGRLAPAAPREA